MASIFFFALLINYQYACAEFLLKDYNKYKDVEGFKSYLVGFGRGMQWLNIVTESEGRKPLICLPQKLSIDETMVLGIIEQEIRKPSDGVPYKEDTSIELIAVRAFIGRFPCK